MAVDPDDVSNEKRAKPQPIGTRSAATKTSTPDGHSSDNNAVSGKDSTYGNN